MLQQIALMIALSGVSSLAVAFLVKVINRVRKNSADYIRSGTRFVYCFLDENDPASFGYREVYGHEYRIKGRMVFVPYSKKRIYLDDRTGSIVASILHDHEADVSLREILVAVDDVYDKMDDISKMSDAFRQDQNMLAINDVKHEVELSAIKRRLKKDDTPQARALGVILGNLITHYRQTGRLVEAEEPADQTKPSTNRSSYDDRVLVAI